MHHVYSAAAASSFYAADNDPTTSASCDPSYHGYNVHVLPPIFYPAS